MTSAELMMMVVISCGDQRSCPKAVYECYTLNTERQQVFDASTKRDIEMVIKSEQMKNIVLTDCIQDSHWRWKK